MKQIGISDFIIPLKVQWVHYEGSELESIRSGTIVGYEPTSDTCYVRENGMITHRIKKSKLSLK